MKTLHRSTCWKSIEGEYVQTNGVTWNYDALVRISYDFEVMNVKLESVSGSDQYGEEVATLEAPLQDIMDHAGAKALSNLEKCDFESDTEES